MNARRAQLQRLDLRADGHQLDSKAILRRGDHAVQHVDNFARVQHTALGVRGQRICGGHQIVRVGQVRREQYRMPRCVFCRGFQALGQLGERANLLAAADRLKLRSIAAQLDGFLCQSEGQRLRPVNVRAAIQIIANPAGNCRHVDFQRPPIIRKGLPGDSNQHRRIGQLRIGRMLDRVLHFVMFALQADLLVPGARVGADLALQCGPAGLRGAHHMIGQCGAQVTGQRKGRVSGKDNAAGGLFHARLEGFEALIGQRFQFFGQARPGILCLAAGMLVAKPLSALFNQVQMNLISQLGHVRDFRIATLQIPEQGLGQCKHGIGQRIDFNPGCLLTQEQLGRGEGLRGGYRCHAARNTEIDVKSKVSARPAEIIPALRRDAPICGRRTGTRRSGPPRQSPARQAARTVDWPGLQRQ